MSWLSNKFTKFSQDGKGKGTRKILCPHCGSTQEVSAKAELTFCHDCKKIINAKKAETASVQEPEEAPTLVLPAEEEPAEKKTKEFREYREPEKTSVRLKTDKDMASAMAVNEVRRVKCSNCELVQDVPTIALSSFCKKCGHRINLQDYEIRGKFQGDLDTRGTIFLSEDAEVKANINVGNAVVRGKIQGTIIAEKSVTLAQTGKIFGKVITPNFIVEDGAIFVGKAEINPPSPEQDKPQGE
jgi:hypothetical protein